MVGELKRKAFVAVLLLATGGCDNNVAAPTKVAMTAGSVRTTVGSGTFVGGGTFVGTSGVAMTCAVDNSAAAFQGPIPVMTNPIPPLGNPIPLLVNPTQSAAAVAIFLPPSISLNLGFFEPLLLPVQAFVFFRECGRFNVTHATGPAVFTGATCWSVRRLRQMSLFGPAERAAIQRFLEQTFPFTTASAPSGADQWRLMTSCL
jgi:hypothetical protein